MNNNPDFYLLYAQLNLSPEASWPEIRQSYKRLAQTWHPDRFPEGTKEQEKAESKFQEISLAYNAIEEHVRLRGIPPLLDNMQQQPDIFDEFKHHPDTTEPFDGYNPYQQSSQQSDSPQSHYSHDHHTNNNLHNFHNEETVQHDAHNFHSNNNFKQHSDSSEFYHQHEQTGNHQYSSYGQFNATDANAYTGTNYQQPYARRKRKQQKEFLNKFYTYIGFIVFLLSMGFIYTKVIKKQDPKQEEAHFELEMPSDTSLVEEVAKSVTQVVEAAAKLSGLSDDDEAEEPIPTAAEESAHTDPSNRRHAVEGLGNKSYSSPPSKYTRTSLNGSLDKSNVYSNSLFSQGDSTTTVIEIHGPPTSIERSGEYVVWYFGKSVIYFKNEKVEEWISHPSFPLASSTNTK